MKKGIAIFLAVCSFAPVAKAGIGGGVMVMGKSSLSSAMWGAASVLGCAAVGFLSPMTNLMNAASLGSVARFIVGSPADAFFRFTVGKSLLEATYGAVSTYNSSLPFRESAVNMLCSSSYGLLKGLVLAHVPQLYALSIGFDFGKYLAHLYFPKVQVPLPCKVTANPSTWGCTVEQAMGGPVGPVLSSMKSSVASQVFPWVFGGIGALVSHGMWMFLPSEASTAVLTSLDIWQNIKRLDLFAGDPAVVQPALPSTALQLFVDKSSPSMWKTAWQSAGAFLGGISILGAVESMTSGLSEMWSQRKDKGYILGGLAGGVALLCYGKKLYNWYVRRKKIQQTQLTYLETQKEDLSEDLSLLGCVGAVKNPGLGVQHEDAHVMERKHVSEYENLLKDKHVDVTVEKDFPEYGARAPSFMADMDDWSTDAEMG